MRYESNPKQWEQLAGDTSRFAVRLAFAPDPDEGRGIGRETGLSWGSFQVWVNGRNLCAHFEEGERIDSVHWYLLPLIEWFVENWNPLLHEERLPGKNDGETAWESLRNTMFPPPVVQLDDRRACDWELAWQDWWNRHALRAASDGGLFPDVVFRRCRDSMEVSWGRVRSAGMPADFDFAEFGPGVAWLSPGEVAAPLHTVLRGACEYLYSVDMKSARFQALRRRLLALRRNDQRQRRLMWLAGLGVDEKTVRDGWRRAKRWFSGIPGATSALLSDSARSPLVVDGSCHATLMFGCVAPDIARDDALRLAEAVVGLHSNTAVRDTLHRARRFCPIDKPDALPWLQGYELAEDFHEMFDGEFATDDSVDIEHILSMLGVTVTELPLSDEKIRGVAIAGPQHRPGIALNPNSSFNMHPWGRRFTLAHELCHLLFDREAGRGLAIASGPWAPLGVERRANAFAAMLLMPPHLVQAAMSNLKCPLRTREGVASVASQLGTGFQSTLRHLGNLGFIDDHDREYLLESIGARSQERSSVH